MTALEPIHARLATTVVLFFIAMAIWGFWRYFRKEGLSSNYWGSLVIAEILILVQGVLGILLWFSNLRPERGGVHILYGIVGALGIPAVYIFTKGGDQRREMLLYAAVFLFLIGISIRSMATG